MADVTVEQAVEQRARELAKEINRDNSKLNTLLSSGKTYQQFNYGEDIIENQKTLVTTPLWSNGLANMTTFYTSSEESSTQKQYYHNIYSTSSDKIDFSISWGHIQGSGSLSGSALTYPSKAIYGQYKQILLNPGDNSFEWSDGTTSDSVYVINVYRNRFKERIDPGNWELNLAMLNGGAHANNVHTGSNISLHVSNKIVSLIDDSSDGDQSISRVIKSGRVFNIVSGTLDGGIQSTTPSYGKFYPDYGIITLNPTVLNSELGFNTTTGSNIDGDNIRKLFISISGSSALSSSYAFQGRASEIMSSTFYFCRVKNGDFNFSNNPSYKTGSLGELRQGSFLNDPLTYVTSVGLYNERQELVAIAKLSQPVLKSFNNELTIKVKLDW